MASSLPAPNVALMTLTMRNTATRPAGWWGLAGAVWGALGGLVTAFLPTSVSPHRFAYPYAPAGFILTELSFAVSHLLVLVGVLGLAWSGALGGSRIGRIGAWVAAVGWVGLAGCEIAALSFWDSAYPTPQTDKLDTAYGVSTLLIGVGLSAMGVAVLRAGVWSGWRRLITLACGAAVFVIILPVVFSGNFTLGRLVLVVWLLMLGGLGYGLATSPPRDATP